VISVVGEVFPLAVGVALSPLPVIAVLVLLPAPAGSAGGVGFLVGRLAGVGAIAGVVSVLSELFAEATTESSTVSRVLRIVLGLGLMAWAIVKWRGRPRGDEAEIPKWMASIDGMSTWGATRLGVIISVANPKELAFGIGAGLTIGAAGLAVGPTVIAVAIYTVIACLTVALPVLAALVGGARMAEPLASAREWMVRNNAAVISVVLLVIGAILVGEGLQGP